MAKIKKRFYRRKPLRGKRIHKSSWLQRTNKNYSMGYFEDKKERERIQTIVDKLEKKAEETEQKYRSTKAESDDQTRWLDYGKQIGYKGALIDLGLAKITPKSIKKWAPLKVKTVPRYGKPEQKNFGSNPGQKKDIWAMSMAEKVKELGHDPKTFEIELFELDDKITQSTTIPLDFSKETIHSKVYPELRKFKEKWGIDVPIGLVGIDIVRLDDKLGSILSDKRN